MEYAAEFPSTFEDVDSQVLEVCSVLDSQPNKLTQELLFIFNYVLRELLNNAVEHGNKMVKEIKVKYRIIFNEEMLKINVWDDTGGFNIDASIKNIQDSETLRERNRGISSVIDLGFQLSVSEGGISAVYLFDSHNNGKESEVKHMEITRKNRTLVCVLHTNLVSMNIKTLIQKLKPHLETEENYDLFSLNLKDVTGIDSMGITFVIGIYKTLMSQNKKMVLCGVAEPMLNLFKIMKLDEIFEIQNA